MAVGAGEGGDFPEAVLQGLVASLSPLVAVVSDISRFLSVFQEPHAGVIQAARQLLWDERAPLRQKLLADLLGTVSENIAAETRAEDPPWFEGTSWILAWRERVWVQVNMSQQ